MSYHFSIMFWIFFCVHLVGQKPVMFILENKTWNLSAIERRVVDVYWSSWTSLTLLFGAVCNLTSIKRNSLNMEPGVILGYKLPSKSFNQRPLNFHSLFFFFQTFFKFSLSTAVVNYDHFDYINDCLYNKQMNKKSRGPTHSMMQRPVH